MIRSIQERNFDRTATGTVFAVRKDAVERSVAGAIGLNCQKRIFIDHHLVAGRAVAEEIGLRRGNVNPSAIREHKVAVEARLRTVNRKVRGHAFVNLTVADDLQITMPVQFAVEVIDLVSRRIPVGRRNDGERHIARAAHRVGGTDGKLTARSQRDAANGVVTFDIGMRTRLGGKTSSFAERAGFRVERCAARNGRRALEVGVLLGVVAQTYRVVGNAQVALARQVDTEDAAVARRVIRVAREHERPAAGNIDAFERIRDLEILLTAGVAGGPDSVAVNRFGHRTAFRTAAGLFDIKANRLTGAAFTVNGHSTVREITVNAVHRGRHIDRRAAARILQEEIGRFDGGILDAEVDIEAVLKMQFVNGDMRAVRTRRSRSTDAVQGETAAVAKRKALGFKTNFARNERLRTVREREIRESRVIDFAERCVLDAARFGKIDRPVVERQRAAKARKRIFVKEQFARTGTVAREREVARARHGVVPRPIDGVLRFKREVGFAGKRNCARTNVVVDIAARTHLAGRVNRETAREVVLARERHVRTGTDSERTGTRKSIAERPAGTGQNEFCVCIGNRHEIVGAERCNIREREIVSARQSDVQVEVLVGAGNLAARRNRELARSALVRDERTRSVDCTNRLIRVAEGNRRARLGIKCAGVAERIVCSKYELRTARDRSFSVIRVGFQKLNACTAGNGQASGRICTVVGYDEPDITVLGNRKGTVLIDSKRREAEVEIQIPKPVIFTLNRTETLRRAFETSSFDVVLNNRLLNRRAGGRSTVKLKLQLRKIAAEIV